MKRFQKTTDVEEDRASCLSRKVHVKGLPLGCDKIALSNAMSQFGPVEKAFIMYSHKNGSSRGFGFVEFKQQSSTDKAVKFKNLKIGGKAITVTKACPKEIEAVQPDLKTKQSSKSISSKDCEQVPTKYNHQIDRNCNQLKDQPSNQVQQSVNQPNRVSSLYSDMITHNQHTDNRFDTVGIFDECVSPLRSQSNIIPVYPIDVSFHRHCVILSNHLHNRWMSGEVRFNIRMI